MTPKNNTSLYEYSVWFRDQNSIPSDQDFEWVVCFIVEAESKEKAQLWGDELSKSYAIKNPNNFFLNSSVALANQSNLPIVGFGTKPSDKYIGW
ncbi:MAG: hypothetical protein ABJN22_03990 [Litorimonas sp.]